MDLASFTHDVNILLQSKIIEIHIPDRGKIYVTESLSPLAHQDQFLGGLGTIMLLKSLGCGQSLRRGCDDGAMKGIDSAHLFQELTE